MKNKTPFDRFVEEAERIRKTPPTDEQIKKINDLSRELEKEEAEAEQENTFPLPKIAGSNGIEIDSQIWGIMGKVIRFSKFSKYIKELNDSGIFPSGTILDANLIITLSYSPKKYHTRTLEFLNKEIYSRDIQCYTTVNTTSEYLEFYRRLLMTEGLRDAIDSASKWDLPNKKKQLIRTQSTLLNNREKNNKADPVFYDREIKKIREGFYETGDVGKKTWVRLCDIFLVGKLQKEYENLAKMGVSYISPNDKSQSEFFQKEMTWENAINICSETCAGFSDTMILNALESTTFPFAVSLDSDIAFAVLSNSTMKDVVMPDDLIDSSDALRKLIQ